MLRWLFRVVAALPLTCILSAPAAPFLAQNGQPTAEIIVAKDAPRTTRLAADELRDYVEKLSGAVVPITTAPSGDFPTKVYVGQSSYTEALGITTEGLKFGAYRLVSGEGWFALIGDDTDFVPIEPWARNNGQIVDGSVQRAWNEITGNTWGTPLLGMYKNYSGSTSLFGTEKEQFRDAGGDVNVWGFDERGSFNAVCGFLRSLGVRWYLPGDLGEVVPDMPTIEVPKIDEIVKPDFEVRRFNVRFSTANRDTMMWAARLGMRDPYGLMVAHGMHNMTHNEEILKNHPDWFALYGGKRDNQPGQRLNHLCYSNSELFEETVEWARALFDHYDLDTVSVMPPDAYISICQCPLCEGKDEPERGSRGKLSNHVWDFVNRVAQEVGKTHPDKGIVCCAYGANTEPPTNIEKLEPNVQVIIVGGRRPRNNLPEQQEEVRQLRAAWLKKTDNPILVFENYPFTDRGWYLPAYTPKTSGNSINETKDKSKGEDIWLSFGRDFDTKGIGFNHFQVYFTARMYWGGPGKDVMAMLDEYCRLFYGPAAESMKDFFLYCEDNWQSMEAEKEIVDTALGKFTAAKTMVPPDSIYAKRLGLIDEFLESLRSRSEQLGKERGPVPSLRLISDVSEGDIVIDGKIDEPVWENLPTASTGRLRELQTGRQPIFGTNFKVAWGRGNVYFAIRCDDIPGQPLNVATTKNEDASLWYGDAIEILVETDSHSYYQIAVNPAGALVDLDRGAQKDAWYRWQSQAEVATNTEDGAWTVEIRIPVTDDENDPLNQIVGRKPIQNLPWYFNVCRQRVRENGMEYSAYSPTAAGTFHDTLKFARIYAGQSHQFPSSEPEFDYIRDTKEALTTYRSGKREAGIEAFVGIANHEGVTPFQKSDALSQAAQCARGVKDFARADEIAGQIPLAEVADSVRMENLLAQRETAKLLEQFGGDDRTEWPFWQAGRSGFLRGQAFAAEGLGEKAEEDLQFALTYTSDAVSRLSVLRAIGVNRESSLNDVDWALEAYREIMESSTATGSSEYFYGLLAGSRLLQEKGDFEGAMSALKKVDIDKMRGTWLGNFLLARGDLHAAAGRKSEARKEFERLLTSDAITRQKEMAAEKLEKLGQ